MTSWHRAACDGNLDILLKIWEWSQEKLTTEEINTKLLLATDNEEMTAWHSTAYEGKLDMLLKIWEWVQENLTRDER